MIPGLLQTEHYARHVLSAYNDVMPISPRVVERRLETRLIRQQLLVRDEPLEHVALIDESVLLRQRSNRLVMQAQLQRLVELAERPNITIRILPLKRNHGVAVDSFAILQFGKVHETALHDVVSVEHLSNELHVDIDNDTHAFRLAFDHLADECLTPAESKELILATSVKVWNEE